MRMTMGATVLMTLVAAPIALAQPAGGNRPPERQDAKKMLERRLDELNAQRERILHAMEQLDAGAPIEDLRAELKEQRGDPGSRAAGHRIDPERLVRILHDMNPQLYDRLRAMEKKNPQMALRMRGKMIQRMRSEPGVAEMARLIEQDPDTYRLRIEQHALEMRAFEAARRFVEATLASDADAAATARAEVRDLLTKQFDLRQKDQRRMIAKAEERLAASRDRIDQMAQERDKEIDHRVDELLRRAMSRANARDHDRRPNREQDRAPRGGPHPAHDLPPRRPDPSRSPG